MAEAEAKWLSDSTNPMIQKKEAGGVLKVAVQGHETIVAEQGVSKQQTMSKRTAMETPEDKQRCSQRARMFHDVASDSHLMQGGGDAFVVGASAVAPPPRPPQARRVRQKSSPATWEDAFAESAPESLDPWTQLATLALVVVMGFLMAPMAPAPGAAATCSTLCRSWTRTSRGGASLDRAPRHVRGGLRRRRRALWSQASLALWWAISEGGSTRPH